MTLLVDSFSSRCRPVLTGRMGTVSAADPLAVAAGQEMLQSGGSAADALIAAQAVLCVVSPDACGLGGDMLALVHHPQGGTQAINGAGAAPEHMTHAASDGANSITVPGIVDGWHCLQERWGRLPLSRLLQPAVRIAQEGFSVPSALSRSVEAHRTRLVAGGASAWALCNTRAGDTLRQPELAGLLLRIGKEGRAAFYCGTAARAIVDAVARLGGSLRVDDLGAHATECPSVIEVSFADVQVAVQPPMTQGVLLAMALQGLQQLTGADPARLDHAAIELTEAAFDYRSRVGEGAALLDQKLPIDMTRAARRGGPRAYLHTAGVAAADAQGLVISSLVSVFDDFGSCVWVPELGLTLNNRAGGFTDAANAPAAGRRPVHTLAPALIRGPFGVIALATPGADGQVQTLLQVIQKIFGVHQDLATAVAAPRWRSEGGALLIESDHPAAAVLKSLGHDIRPLPPGDLRFGAVVCAGLVGGRPIALADWRRGTWSGVA